MPLLSKNKAGQYAAILFLSAALAASHIPQPCMAQTKPQPSMDTDIRAIRDNAVPNFSCNFDDYLQYGPGALLLGLKAAGYESRSCWGRMAVSDAFSAILMGGITIGFKEAVNRQRPDGSDGSFPSGHSARAFALATMLHKEYGWKNQWISFGGYAAATATALGRILNGRHWHSDIAAGAIIGTGAAELGYFIADKIFNDKYLTGNFSKDKFVYDLDKKYYGAAIYFGRRFILGGKESKETGDIPYRSSMAGIEVEIPLVPRSGILFRTGAGSLNFKSPHDGAGSDMTYGDSYNIYDAKAGAYWAYPFAKRLEMQLYTMLGYAWHGSGNGIDAAAGTSLAIFTGDNYKIKAFAEFETFSFDGQKPLITSFIAGYSAVFCW